MEEVMKTLKIIIVAIAIVASLFATAGMACEDVINTDGNYSMTLDLENDS